MNETNKADEVIRDILELATIDGPSLLLAQERWKELSEMRSNTFQENHPGQLEEDERTIESDSFDGIIRLIYECEKLNERFSFDIPDEDSAWCAVDTLVLDADLFRNFSEIDSDPRFSYRGFNFFKDKIQNAHNYDSEDPDHQISRSYFLAVLTELFRSNNSIAITRSGISELSNLPNHFLRSREDQPMVDYQRDRLLQAEKHAIQITRDVSRATDRINTMTKLFGLSDEQRTERADDAFSQISNSIAIPSSINNYVLARLNYAMRSTQGRLGRLNSSVAASLREKGNNADADDFEFIFRQINLSYGPKLNSARRSLESAFKLYLKTALGDTFSESELSYGQIENVSALFEIHLVNCILNQLGIPHRALYVHKNVSVFNFLRGFARGRLAVPSLHPRFAFFVLRPELLTKQVRSGDHTFLPIEHLRVVGTVVSSFESRIFADEVISNQEYKIFSKATQNLLDQLESLHCSVLIEADEFEEEKDIRRAQARAAYEGITEYFGEITHKCEQYKEDWSQKNITKDIVSEVARVENAIVECRSVLEKFMNIMEDALLISKVSLLEQRSHDQQIRRNSVFSRSAIMHMDECVEALNQITRNSEKPETRQVLVTVFRPKGRGKPIRTSVIPLNGGYRYLFSLHSAPLARHVLKQIGDGTQTIQNFCDTVLPFCSEHSNVDTVSLEGVLLSSCKYMVSAFQSANLRNWSLALTLVETAVGYLNDGLATNRLAKNTTLLAQRAECYALQQIALRALSEETHVRSRKKLLLERAHKSLERGLIDINSVDSQVMRVSTPLVPQSIRFFTSRVAIEVEKDLSILRGILPKETTLSWERWFIEPKVGLPDLSNLKLAELEKLSQQPPAKEKYVALKAVAVAILEQAISSSQMVTNGTAVGHSVHMWEYVCLRCAQILDFVYLVEFVSWSAEEQNYADYKCYSHNLYPELVAMRDRLAERDRELMEVTFDDSCNVSEDWGLMAGLKFYFDICEEFATDKPTPPPQSKRSSWQKLSVSCSRLVQTGLPRYLVNELKDGIKQEFAVRNSNATT